MTDVVQYHRGHRRAILLIAALAMFALLISSSICIHRFVLFPLEHAKIDEDLLAPGANISLLKEHLKSRGIEYSTIDNELYFKVYIRDFAAFNRYLFYRIAFSGSKVIIAKYENVVDAF